MNKKMTIVVAIAMCVCSVFARPHGGPGGFGGGHRPAPVMHHHAPVYHHHHSAWGRGGRYFWPGFVGGVIGGALTSSIYPTTTVVTTPVVTTPVVTTPVVSTPVYTTQQVWVPGGYVDQVQPNGTVVRVWQPGRYVTRQVLVQ